MFDAAVLDLAARVLEACRRRHAKLVTAESCTGGLLAAALSAVPGASDVLDRGYVAYSYAAKTALLAVPDALLARSGAVSEAVARAMVEGALEGRPDRIAVAVTGVAGPGSDSRAKPAGLVHMAAGDGAALLHRRRRYGDRGRAAVREAAVVDALRLLLELTR